ASAPARGFTEGWDCSTASPRRTAWHSVAGNNHHFPRQLLEFDELLVLVEPVPCLAIHGDASDWCLARVTQPQEDGLRRRAGRNLDGRGDCAVVHVRDDFIG